MKGNCWDCVHGTVAGDENDVTRYYVCELDGEPHDGCEEATRRVFLTQRRTEMKMTDEARKAAGDRMRALNAKRKMQKEKVKPWRDTVVIIDTEFGPKQVPPKGDVIQVNLRAPEYTWLNVYFEDGRAFKIPVDHILQITNPIAPLPLTGREIVSLAETLEWAQLRGKAIPIVREQVVDETKAWRTARKELR